MMDFQASFCTQSAEIFAEKARLGGGNQIENWLQNSQ
jgi:hypothetical protein